MEDSDAATVARARAGDNDAFRTLVDRHSRTVFRVAYRMTGSSHDAEDLVQETFLRAYRKIGNFEDRANFGTWLYRIAVNCTLDWMRRNRKHRELDHHGEQDHDRNQAMQRTGQTSPDRTLFRLEVQRRVKSALQELSPLERSAFILRHYEGMSIEEIAGGLGMGANAVKHSVFRAVRKMRRALAPMMSLAE